MEMENSALLQVMATQTSILEEIRELRRKDVMQGQPVSAISPNDATSQISMVNPEMMTPEMPEMPEIATPAMSQMDLEPITPYDGRNYYGNMTPQVPGMTTNPQPMTLQNPLSYQSVSKIPVVGGVAGAATAGIEDAFSFDPSRMSKEAAGEYFAQRSRGVQMGAVEGTGNVIQGAGSIGGFMVGGLIGGLAVGTAVGAGTAYMANEMTQGAEAALNYQDILRQDGYKAFNAVESTTEYGGIGLKLDDQQELGSFMRDEAVDNFLDDDEMSTILQGSLDNKLLKSVDDVKSFKEKFSGIVKTVKEISLTLDQTIDEAIEFMGEMERRGVGADKMAGVASSSKVAASFLGMDAGQYTEQMLQQTDSIVQGTTADAENVMEGLNFNSYLVSGIAENSAEGDGVLKQYIKNRGGEGAVAGEVESNLRGYYEGAGQDSLLAMFGGAYEQDEQGNFSINEEKLDELLNSEMSVSELTANSTAALSELDESSKVKLSMSAGSIFNQNATSEQLMKTAEVTQDQFQEISGGDMDDETALVNMGIATDQDQARLMNEMLIAGTDESAQDQFGVLAYKEEMDSAKRAANPGVKKRIKFWWEENVANPLGDIGENVANPIGDIGEDLQMWSAGIEKDGLSEGEMLDGLTADTESVLFTGDDSNTEKLQTKLQEINPELKEIEEIKELEDTKMSFTPSEWQQTVKQAEAGELSAEDLKEMRKNLDDEKYTGGAAEQAEYIINSATGQYDGFFGKLDQGVDWTKAMFIWNGKDDVIREGEFNSGEELEEQSKELAKEVKSSTKDLNKLLSGNEDIGVADEELGELQELIEAGDYKAVEAMTSNQDVLDITKTFEGHNEKQMKIDEASEIFSENFKNTQGVLTLTEGLYDFIDVADTQDQKTFDAKYGDKRKELSEEMNDLSKDLLGMDDQGVADTFSYAMDQRENAIEALSMDERVGLAEKMVQIDDSVSLESLYKEGSSSEIDTEKLNKHILNIQKAQNTNENQAADAVSSTEEVSKAAGEHSESINVLTETLVAETAKMNEAIEALKTKNYGSRTGLS